MTKIQETTRAETRRLEMWKTLSTKQKKLEVESWEETSKKTQFASVSSWKRRLRRAPWVIKTMLKQQIDARVKYGLRDAPACFVLQESCSF